MTQQFARSARLYNEELSPESATGTWHAHNLFNWWMSAWHSVAGYTMAIGLFVFGLTGWQVLIAFLLGVTALYIVNNLTGVAGQRERVPFPVFARGSFGIFGANIPAVIRAIVAVVWYGIQTYLASGAVMLLVVKMWPALTPAEESGFLGLSFIGWVCFIALSALQLVVLLSGMESVRKLSDFAGPTIWVALLVLAVWMLIRADWKIDLNDTLSDVVPGFGGQLFGMITAGAIIVSYFAGPTLNFADFTRNSPSEAAVRKGNLLGLLLNATAFGAVSVVIALASKEVYGEVISDPIHLLADVDSVTLLLVAIIAISLATAGINIVCNFVAPVYDLINIWPKHFNFRRAGLLVAVLSIVITPWNLFANTFIVQQLIGGIGALIGPLFGIVVVDYYIVQRKRLVTEELFTEDPRGRYHYSGGYNLRAVASLVIGGTIAVLVALLPFFHDVVKINNFSWFIGSILAATVYILLNQEKTRAQRADAGDAEQEMVSSGRAS